MLIGQALVRIVDPVVRADDVSPLVNPANAGTDQTGAPKMDRLEFSLAVADKSVKHAVSVAEGTGQHAPVILGHPHVLAIRAGYVDVMKHPILQKEATLDSGGVEMRSDDVTRVVDSASPCTGCPRVVNLGELSVAQQKSVVIAIGVREASSDVAPSVQGERSGQCRAGKVDSGKETFVQQESVGDTLGIKVAANNISPSVDAIRESLSGVGEVNFHEPIVGRR